jgi:hypothetical protein
MSRTTTAIAYLTHQEQSRLDGLEYGAMLLFGVAVVNGYLQKNPKNIEKVKQWMARMLYAATHPSSWPGFATDLRRHLVDSHGVVSAPRHPETLSLLTALPISTCQTNLRRTLEFNTIGPVLGEVSAHRFHMYVYRKDLRNSFKPHFYGKLSTTASGTRITGKFRMHIFVKIFLCVWFGGLVWIATKIAILSFPYQGRSPYTMVIFIAALASCGLLISYGGRTLGSDDKSQMSSFLQHTLRAQPETSIESASKMS